MSTAEIAAPPQEWSGTESLGGPPDHLGLPESDGRIVENYLEHPQAAILSNSLFPVLIAKHPDGRFALGRDLGIYYKWEPDDPLAGAIAPDWLYVPDVPPKLDGAYRRSYVLWKEGVAPMIVVELASGDGSAERDRTPPKGKFWVYERIVRPSYYAIHVAGTDRLEVHEHVRNRFQRMEHNPRGRFPIPELGIELGIWHGRVENVEGPWIRWFDTEGELLPSGQEMAAIESARANIESARANIETARADRLAAQLRSLGIDPEA